MKLYIRQLAALLALIVFLSPCASAEGLGPTVVARSASGKTSGGTKFVAHRGSAHWPENTLEAFRNYTQTGADGVELDARSTLDGYQVICHDEEVVVDGVAYPLLELTLDQLRTLAPEICTLEEALDVLSGMEGEIHLELKLTADAAKCVAAVAERGLQDRTLFFSFHENQLVQAYEADPSARLGMSLTADSKPTSKSVLDKAKRLHVSVLVLHRKIVFSKVVKTLHQRGYQVCVWTVNDRDEFKKFYKMKVDYILSDYPEYGEKLRK